MSFTDKLALYEAGKFSCEVPPVPHALWSDSDWVRWIDSHGKWN